LNPFDWQISLGGRKFQEIAPEMPQPGYDKEGKRIIGEKAISPKPEGCNEGWRRWLGGSKLTFGVNNLFDTRPLFADYFAGFDSGTTNPIGRFFYVDFKKNSNYSNRYKPTLAIAATNAGSQWSRVFLFSEGL
jgi:hypothetical protein